MVGWGGRGDPLPSSSVDRFAEVSANTTAQMEDGSNGTASLRRHLANAETAFRRHSSRRQPLEPHTPFVRNGSSSGGGSIARGSGVRGINPPGSDHSPEVVESGEDSRTSDWEGYPVFGTTSQSWSQSTMEDYEVNKDSLGGWGDPDDNQPSALL